MVLADPVKLSAFRVNIPVTITSSMALTSDFNVISNWSVDCVTWYFWDCIPKKEICKVSPAETSSWNSPFTSVAVPILVPSIKMVAPITAAPLSSVILPFTRHLFSWFFVFFLTMAIVLPLIS